MVLWTLVYIYLFKSLLSGLLDVVSEVELISHGNSMFNFLGNYLAVFHSAELLYIFTSCAQRFQFFYILRTYCISFFFIHSKSHPNRFEVISHWWFWFSFPWLVMLCVISCFYWPSICLLWRNVYSVGLPFVCSWVVGVLYIFWILISYQLFDLYIFSPFFG